MTLPVCVPFPLGEEQLLTLNSGLFLNQSLSLTSILPEEGQAVPQLLQYKGAIHKSLFFPLLSMLLIPEFWNGLGWKGH